MEVNEIRKALSKCSIFDGFDDAQLDFLITNARVRHFAEETTIYAKGEEASEAFCLMVSGKAKIISDSGQILQIFGPNEIIGEIGTISPQRRRTITLGAATAVALLEWDLKTIEKELPELFPRLRDLARKRTLKWNY
jgi:CRP-like cAMP-binding protein